MGRDAAREVPGFGAVPMEPGGLEVFFLGVVRPI